MQTFTHFNSTRIDGGLGLLRFDGRDNRCPELDSIEFAASPNRLDISPSGSRATFLMPVFRGLIGEGLSIVCRLEADLGDVKSEVFMADIEEIYRPGYYGLSAGPRRDARSPCLN